MNLRHIEIFHSVYVNGSVSGAARAASGDIASAPATPAAEAPIRWRRLTSMIASPADAFWRGSAWPGVTQKCGGAW